MSKTKKNTTTKTSAKPAKASAAQREEAVAQAQATDAAANASAVAPAPAPAPAKGTKAKMSKAPKAAKPQKSSGLNAALQVLTDAGQPMRCKDMVETMLAKGLWKTDGRTPQATIYAAVIREIAAKGDKSRFKKTDRGLFTVNA